MTINNKNKCRMIIDYECNANKNIDISNKIYNLVTNYAEDNGIIVTSPKFYDVISGPDISITKLDTSEDCVRVMANANKFLDDRLFYFYFEDKCLGIKVINQQVSQEFFESYDHCKNWLLGESSQDAKINKTYLVNFSINSTIAVRADNAETAIEKVKSEEEEIYNDIIKEVAKELMNGYRASLIINNVEEG